MLGDAEIFLEIVFLWSEETLTLPNLKVYCE